MASTCHFFTEMRRLAIAGAAASSIAITWTSSALAQRGMLDDIPLTKEKPAAAPPGATAPPQQPPRRPETMAIPRETRELEGCWHSETGELPVFDSRSGVRIGTSRNCFCFRKDGRGAARIIYTSQNNVPVKGTGKVCEGTLTATIGVDTLTFQYPGNIPCTDGEKFAPFGPVTWVCKGTQDGRSACEQQPPYGGVRATYARVSNDYCGWR